MRTNSTATLRIRQPQFADNAWYSADPAQLTANITQYLSPEPLPFEPEQLLGLVVPHAGHRFSGHVAGAAFAALQPGLFDTVILLGPDHRNVAAGRTATTDVKLWRTPLGDTAVAWEILEPVHKTLWLARPPADEEHSLEIELPFLQFTLGQFRLIPLMMSDQSYAIAQQVSRILLDACREQHHRPLFVASSDLSHYFDDTAARKLDAETIDFILNLDARGLLDHIHRGRLARQPLACGAGPIAAAILAARAQGATQAHLLKYATSADVHPDPSRVVGYAAIAFTK
jgi:hypothetical protein